jgi:hypothetical protein
MGRNDRSWLGTAARDGRLARVIRAELRRPHGLFLGLCTFIAALVLSVPLAIALIAAVATLALKLALEIGFAPGRARISGTEHSGAGQWLGRGTLAVRSLRDLTASAEPGPLADRCQTIGDRALATLEVMRRLAQQESTVATLLHRVDQLGVADEARALERELAVAPTVDMRAEVTRSLASIRAQLQARDNLRLARDVLLSKIRTVVLGLEGLVARVAEVIALGQSGVGMSEDRIGELEAELEALRGGLLETEAIGRSAMAAVAPPRVDIEEVHP